MSICKECGTAFDPSRDAFVTFHERKGPSIDLCSVECTVAWVKDDPASTAVCDHNLIGSVTRGWGCTRCEHEVRATR